MWKENGKPIAEDVCGKYYSSATKRLDVKTWISFLLTEKELAEYYEDDLFEVKMKNLLPLIRLNSVVTARPDGENWRKFFITMMYTFMRQTLLKLKLFLKSYQKIKIDGILTLRCPWLTQNVIQPRTSNLQDIHRAKRM